jgi:hypothetical protein
MPLSRRDRRRADPAEAALPTRRPPARPSSPRTGYSAWLPVNLRAFSWIDLAVALAVLVLLYGIVAVGLVWTRKLRQGGGRSKESSELKVSYY